MVFFIALFVFPEGLIPDPDMVFWMIPFSILVFNGMNDIGPISRRLNHHGTKVWAWLGKLSLYLYLLHFQIVTIWAKAVPIENPIIGSLVILMLSREYHHESLEKRIEKGLLQ